MKKLISVFLSGVIFITIAGCSGKSSNSENKIINKGEVVDDAGENLLIDGVSVNVPFTLEDLGEGFSFDENQYFSESNGSYFLVTFLMHNNSRLMEVQFYDLTKDYENNADLLKKTDINYISVEEGNEGEVVFDGVKVGDNISKLDKWGEPSSKSDGYMQFNKYTDENTSIKGTLSVYYGSSDSDIIDTIKLHVGKS